MWEGVLILGWGWGAPHQLLGNSWAELNGGTPAVLQEGSQCGFPGTSVAVFGAEAHQSASLKLHMTWEFYF